MDPASSDDPAQLGYNARPTAQTGGGIIGGASFFRAISKLKISAKRAKERVKHRGIERLVEREGVLVAIRVRPCQPRERTCVEIHENPEAVSVDMGQSNGGRSSVGHVDLAETAKAATRGGGGGRGRDARQPGRGGDGGDGSDDDESMGGKKDSGKHRQIFDLVSGPRVSQKRVYAMMGRRILSKFMAGYNGTIFAYGQTGSGKTHTMIGTEAQPGITPQLCSEIFTEIAERSSAVKYKLQVRERGRGGGGYCLVEL